MWCFWAYCWEYCRRGTRTSSDFESSVRKSSISFSSVSVSSSNQLQKNKQVNQVIHLLFHTTLTCPLEERSLGETCMMLESCLQYRTSSTIDQDETYPSRNFPCDCYTPRGITSIEQPCVCPTDPTQDPHTTSIKSQLHSLNHWAPRALTFDKDAVKTTTSNSSPQCFINSSTCGRLTTYTWWTWSSISTGIM